MKKTENQLISFEGMHSDMYSFFWEIAFHNETSFFEANRKRYKESVQIPLQKLSALLMPTALEIDPVFNPNPTAAVSRIRRDTRYTKDKSPYRDYMWIEFRPPKQHTSECFVIYADFERESYGYGMGMYAPVPELMNEIRERIIANPKKFLKLVNQPEFRKMFDENGESYKKERYLEYPEDVRFWLNKKRLTFHHRSTELSDSLKPELKDEIEHAMNVMKPVYRFIRGLD